ncbi:MAG: SDR family NAD(P)-dependent oxidoreductase, partial [Gammaproteobacteria bacterium]|nr:SDR family NAD(P)-dependent oxidoreductase [Gammaproteobacteria bacterium]
MSVNNNNNTAHTQLVPVSARTKDSLRMNVQQLHSFLQRMSSQKKEDVGQLQAFAHTLQSGRTALNTRTAFIVSSLVDAQQQFERFLHLFEQGGVDDSIVTLRNSEIEQRQEQLHDTPVKAVGDMSSADFEQVKTNWLAGYPIRWQVLYQGQQIKRMRLPSYAFSDVGHRSEQPQQTALSVRATHEFSSPLVLTPQWTLLDDAPCSNLEVKGLEVLLVGAGANKVDLTVLEQQHIYAQVLEFDVEDSISNLCDKLDEMVRFDSIVFVPPDTRFDLADATNTIEAQASGVKYVFTVLKALLRSGFDNESLGLYFLTHNAQAVFDGEMINPTHTGISGLAGVIAKEHVNWQVRCIDLAQDVLSEKFMDILSVNRNEFGNHLALRNHHWYQPVLSKLTLPSSVPSPYKQHGVYLVIGGAGSIGFDWTKMVVEKYNATVIWFGRRPVDERITRKLAHFPPATRPIYMSVDASDLEAFSQAHQQITQQYGQIDGVIHSAMVVKGQNVATLDEQSFAQLLQAKINVCVNIAKVFAHHPTDFLLFFSSINAYTKSLGQSGYAVGCTFKDAFAQALGASHNAYTINFGYWDSDVINLEETKGLRSWMAREGMATVTPQEAFPIIERFLSSSVRQISLLKVTKAHALREMNVNLGTQNFATVQADTQTIERHMSDLYGRICIDDVRQSDERHFELDSSHTIARLLATFLAAKLYELNILKTSAVAKDTLVDITQVAPKYHLWVASSIEFLLDYQFVYKTEQGYQLDEQKLISTQQFWQTWQDHKTQWHAHQNLIAQLQFVELTCRELELVLQDKKTASELLFPGASMHLVEEIYKHSNAGKYYNQVVAQAVFNLVAERVKQDPNAKINMLEVGAGTGATSAEIFSRLQEFEQNIAEYRYTDISKAFLLHAQTHYGPSHGYLDYAIVNLEQPYAQSGLLAEHYDIVIATNVIHATSDILASMNNVKGALKAGGTLYINEVCSRSIFTHLTFGLLDGWWLQRDPQLRLSGSPALSVAQWQTVFERMSFVSHVITDNVEANAMQSVIAAQKIQKLTTRAQDAEPSQRETTSRTTLAQETIPSDSKKELLAPPAKFDSLEEHIETTIVSSLETILKVSKQEIQTTESFVDYGLDSILGLSFVEQINELLGITLNPTCIFDYSSVERLSAHILSDYQAQIQCLSAPEPMHPAAQEYAQNVQPSEINSEQPHDAKQEIAIIGMSGQASGAKNLDELWRLLSSGTIATGEINA